MAIAVSRTVRLVNCGILVVDVLSPAGLQKAAS
jgi:hypothetical protein